MDGVFVSTRSVNQKTVLRIKQGTIGELHLMVTHPLAWLPVVVRLKIPTVIIHAELGRNLGQPLAVFRQQGVNVLLAINPTTPLSKLRPWAQRIQGVVVMGVHPGAYGARWQTKTTQRIQAVKKLYPRLPVSTDGGVSEKTIQALAAAGIDRGIVGSYIQRSNNPRRAWRRLQTLAGQPKK
jgi:ribulose-phosphate 3-epimerase